MFRNWVNENEQEQKFHDNSVTGVSQWIIIISIMLVPILNIVMLLKWAFSNKELCSANKVNFARAAIIVFVILLIAVCIVAFLLQLGWYMHCCLNS